MWKSRKSCSECYTNIFRKQSARRGMVHVKEHHPCAIKSMMARIEKFWSAKKLAGFYCYGDELFRSIISGEFISREVKEIARRKSLDVRTTSGLGFIGLAAQLMSREWHEERSEQVRVWCSQDERDNPSNHLFISNVLFVSFIIKRQFWMFSGSSTFTAGKLIWWRTPQYMKSEITFHRRRLNFVLALFQNNVHFPSLSFPFRCPSARRVTN